MLCGPNQSLYRHLLARVPTLAVQASGGVRDLDDVIAARGSGCAGVVLGKALLEGRLDLTQALSRSEEHTSELQSLMRISYAVFCLKKKKPHTKIIITHTKQLTLA